MLDRMRRFAEAQDERSRKNHARKLDNLRRSLKAPFLVGYSRFFYFLTIGGPFFSAAKERTARG